MALSVGGDVGGDVGELPFSSFNIIKHSARPDFRVDFGRPKSEAIMSETSQYA